MPLSPEAKYREELIQKLSWAFGTLKSAVSNWNISYDVKGCEDIVAGSQEAAAQQIARIRQHLDQLEGHIRKDPSEARGL